MASLFDSLRLYVQPGARTSIVLTVVAITSVTIVAAFKILHKKRETRKNAATVTKLTIYPVKSVQGIVVDHLNITPNCCSFNDFDDRSMILLNKDNRMISLRQNGSLARIRSSFTGKSELTLKAEGMEDLIIRSPKISPDTGNEVIHFSVWGSETSGQVLQEASSWFSRFLNEPGVRLVAFTAKSQPRPTQIATPKGSTNENKYKIRYQDGSPVHLCNETTLDALNQLAEGSSKKFDMEAMRPNIVVRSAIPYEELSWYSCYFDSITYYNVRACTRCVIPTMDISTGERDPDKTSIMRTHRSAVNDYEEKNYQQNPLFGINLVPNKSGLVKVGSVVDATF